MGGWVDNFHNSTRLERHGNVARLSLVAVMEANRVGVGVGIELRIGTGAGTGTGTAAFVPHPMLSWCWQGCSLQLSDISGV